MYAENQTKWLSEYLQAELTIVSTSQTKHLIPCFQHEFDLLPPPCNARTLHQSSNVPSFINLVHALARMNL